MESFSGTNFVGKGINVGGGSHVQIGAAYMRTFNGVLSASDSHVFVDGGSDLIAFGSEFIDGYEGCAIRLGSSGDNTVIKLFACNLVNNSLNFDVLSSTGSIFCVVSKDTESYNIVDGGLLSGLFQVTSERATKQKGNVLLGYESEREVSLKKYLNIDSSSGIITGGDVDGYTDVLTALVYAGSAWVRREAPELDLVLAEWETQTISLTNEVSNYIFINANTLALTTSTSAPSTNNAILAEVVTGGGVCRYVHDLRTPVSNIQRVVQDYLIDTRRFALSNGLSTSIGTGATKFEVDSGDYYRGLEQIVYSGSSGDASFSYFYGTDAATEVAGQTDIDENQYDLSGTLTAIPDGYFKVDSLVLTSDERLSLLYGTSVYASQLLAEAANPTPTIPSFMDTSGILVANLVIEDGYGIVSVLDKRPVASAAYSSGGGGGGGSSISNHGLLSGLDDDDHSQYLLVDGSRAMGGNLDLSSNNINNIGLINSVDITDHSSRHNPGGIDALATGTPVKAIVGEASSAGSAASYAISDHQHGIDAGTPVDVGSANSEGSASTVARSDHVHDHGQLAGGAFHEVATTSSAGFMSAADKQSIIDFEQSKLILDIVNRTGSTIPINSIVHSKGVDPVTGFISVGLADKDDATRAPGIGITIRDVLHNETCTALKSGLLTGQDTSSYYLGQQLVLGNNGNFTTPPPINTSFTTDGYFQMAGSILSVDAVDGYIGVGFLAGVLPPNGGQIFAWQGTDGTPSNANRFVTDSDPRNTDSRTPTGSAGGQLGGTYPNPSVVALTTSGLDALTIGAVEDGYILNRSGSSIVGNSLINSGAQWNANKIQNKSISSSPPSNEDILEFSNNSWAPTSHKQLDQLSHNLAENAYTEHTYSNSLVSNITIYTNSGKTTKIREEQFTYNSSNYITTIVKIQYDGNGSIKERLTDTYSYTNGSVSNYTSVFEEF